MVFFFFSFLLVFTPVLGFLLYIFISQNFLFERLPPRKVYIECRIVRNESKK